MVATLADLDAAIAAEGVSITSLNTLAQQLVTDVAALAAKVTAGVDFTNELTAVQSNAALLSSATASVTTADTSTKA